MKRKSQINQSKELILQGLLELMQTMEYDEITLTQIAKQAEVSRMTLYRHFNQKEDILLFEAIKISQKILDKVNSSHKLTLKCLLTLKFKSLQEYPYTLILSKHNKLEQLLEITTVHILPSICQKEIIPVSSNTYIQTFFKGGLDAITRDWIENGMIEPYEKIVDQILYILNPFMHQ
ncbi:hypothetical protein AN639_04940 [Candidatus Epulonipiscium fishelsonii]|uniref:Uncharacterized protein n=1 Tax=Candidatus Epulonipiscium fishelsonii TaxID=77094 RepID=A0ACC8XDG1_9FIRM|nr:hypothetical protein AN639_04940 [Epulopiscium sp. SCG-B05WGA-EpuloA1]ONI40826.1 hypothetical protein AN396_05245 [Epulopiscium sp. SCG-B11WGA-EpuloA1]